MEELFLRHALNGPLHAGDRLLAEHPQLRDRFAVQLVLGDRKAVESRLAEDSELAVRPAGPRARDPIVLLCFSLYQNARDPAGPGVEISLNDKSKDKSATGSGTPADFAAILERLLQLGANPNAALPTGDDHALPVLFAVLGHAYHPQAAELLIRAGAEVNDGESLYHAAERADSRGLALLLQNGARLAGTNALKRKLDFDHFESFELILNEAPDLDHALEESPNDSGTSFTHAIRRMRDARYLKALLQAGARIDARFQGHDACALAAILGNESAQEYLENLRGNSPHGDRSGDAKTLKGPRDLSDAEQALAAAVRGDRAAVEELLASRPGLIAGLSEWDRTIHTELAKYDRRTAVRVLIESGLCEINTAGESGMTALHQAAWFGYADLLADLLVFQPDLRQENMYGGTALETAIYASTHCTEDRASAADYPECVRRLLSAARNSGDATGLAFSEEQLSAASDAVAAVLRKHSG